MTSSLKSCMHVTLRLDNSKYIWLNLYNNIRGFHTVSFELTCSLKTIETFCIKIKPEASYMMHQVESIFRMSFLEKKFC